MTDSPLQTFREMVIALGLEADLSVTPLRDISNTTGAPDPCGFIPDVYGNNAYFNTLCLPNGALNSKSINMPVAQADVAHSTVSVPPNTFTLITPGWTGGLEDTDSTVYTLLPTGIQVNFSGTYLAMVAWNWTIETDLNGTYRSMSLTQNGVALQPVYATPVTAKGQITTYNYPLAAGTLIQVGVQHDDTIALPSPDVGLRLVLLTPTV